MNAKQYDKWIKSHQTCMSDVDISDAVMDRIAQKNGKPDVLKRAYGSIMLEMIQTRRLVKAGVLASGAFMGLLRMFLQVYSVLFT